MQNTIKLKHIWVVCVCEKETVSHHMTVFITSRATWIIIIWFELSIFSLPSMKSSLHYHDEDENTQFKYPLGRDVPDAVHYMGKRAGSPDLVRIWNFKGILSKTSPLTIHKNKSLLSIPPGRPQDFKLETSQYAVHQCWTFWLAWRSNQTLHSDSNSELKQIHHTCWEQGWRVSWWSISILGTQELWSVLLVPSLCTQSSLYTEQDSWWEPEANHMDDWSSLKWNWIGPWEASALTCEASK